MFYKTVVPIVPGHRWHKGKGAGCQYQLVIAHNNTGLRCDSFGRQINTNNLVACVAANFIRVVKALSHHIERFGTALFKPTGQMHPVIGRPGFFTKNTDVPTRSCCNDLFHQPVAHRPIPHHYQSICHFLLPVSIAD